MDKTRAGNDPVSVRRLWRAKYLTNAWCYPKGAEMRVYRTEEAMFNDSLEIQVLEQFLFGVLENVTSFSFEQLMDMCPDVPTQEAALDVLVFLLDDMVLYETAEGLRLNRPLEAMHRTGFYTDDVLHLVPEETRLLSLTDRTIEMLDNNPYEDVIAYMAQLLGPELEAAEVARERL